MGLAARDCLAASTRTPGACRRRSRTSTQPHTAAVAKWIASRLRPLVASVLRMLNNTQMHSEPSSPEPSAFRRPGRALIGWLEPDAARLVLTARRQDIEPADEQLAHAERARGVVAGRSA